VGAGAGAGEGLTTGVLPEDANLASPLKLQAEAPWEGPKTA